MIPTLKRQRPADLMSLRTAWSIEWDSRGYIEKPVLKNQRWGRVENC